MGGGGLRILPHKKWHVWRRDNIERVLRDEREHEEKQQAIDAKERQVAQERRAQQLQVEVAQREKDGSNRKQQYKEVADTLRRHGIVPWYAQSEDMAKEEPTAPQERKRKRELDEADPLHCMRPKDRSWLLSEKDKRRYHADEGRDRRQYLGRYDCSSPDCNDRRPRKSPTHSKTHYKGKSTATRHASKESLLQKLRSDRMKREEVEHRKAEKLMQ